MPSVTLLTSTTGTTLLAAPNNTRSFYRIWGYQITSQDNPGRVTLVSNGAVIVGVSSFSDSGGGLCAPANGVNGEPYADAAPGTAITVGLENAVAVDFTVQYSIVGR